MDTPIKEKQKEKQFVQHGQWSSGQHFILAAAGAAIGLNNIWQFPYVTGSHGGGLFLLVYVLCLTFIVFPLFTSEVIVGRLGRSSPIQTIRRLVDRTNGDPNWNVLGSIKTFTGFLVLSYLSVIAGWAIAYALRAGLGMFEGLTADGVNSLFTEFVQDPEKQIFWHSLFMVMTMVVVARGLKSGFEPVIRIVVPLLFILLTVLLIYAATLDNFNKAAQQLFYPDFNDFGIKSVLIAMGHAFFSLGLGFGVLMMYGAYLPDEVSVSRAALWVIVLDTLAGILAGVTIYALLFASDQQPVSGPLLIFKAIPLATDVLPYGQVVAVLFFVLLVLAAWVTAIALVEPAMAWLEETHAMSRFWAAIWCGLGAWLLGIVTILSFNYWAFSFKFFGLEKHLGLFDSVQILTSNFLLPMGGMLVALFAGWSLNRSLTKQALNFRFSFLYDAWLWLVRIVMPIVLIIIMFSIPKLFL